MMGRPTAQELVRRAGSLAKPFARRARAAEAAQRLPEETIGELVESELLRVLQPARYGGYEMDMPTFVRLVLEIARQDAASGWIYAIFGIHNWWLGYVDPQLQEEMWGDRADRLFADAFAPVGRVEPMKGGYRLSGRWKFLSGVEWSDYVAVGAMLSGEGGEPEYVMFFLPRGDYRIEDDWHVVGLRATASNTVVVDDAFIPPY